MKFNLKTKKPVKPNFDLVRTKVIATLGPATHSLELVEELLLAGVDGFRLNFSHDDHAAQKQRIEWVRKASAKYNRPVAVIQDLQGPKMRIGVLPEKLQLSVGQPVKFAYQTDYVASGIIPTQFDLSRKLKPGQRMLLNDGTVRVKVKTVRQGIIGGVVEAAGVLTSRKGINLPDTNLAGDIITPKDRDDIKFGVEQDVDYMALSFVQDAGDIKELRQYLHSLKAKARIIAKIETKAATEHIEEIVAASDAVMVARGDLASETLPESVPIVQREITGLCMQYGKISIVATQMMASMVDSTEPTRAEVSDVASAVITGVDALMLSEETAVGNFPVLTVQTMVRIADYAEKNPPIKPIYLKQAKDASQQDAISAAVVSLADQVGARAIVAETISGSTALSLAAYRPNLPIMMVASSQKVANQLSIAYGGISFYRKSARPANEKIFSWLKKQGALKSGDEVVIASGRQGVVGSTDTLKVRLVP